MTNFNSWQASRSAQASSEQSIRQSARAMIESGRITLREARFAAERRKEFANLKQAQQTMAVANFTALATRANVDREGWPYDRHNLCGADSIFIDELTTMVAEFDASPKQAAADPPSAGAVGRSSTGFPPGTICSLDEIIKQTTSDWCANKDNCQSMYRDLTTMALERRRAMRNPQP